MMEYEPKPFTRILRPNETKEIILATENEYIPNLNIGLACKAPPGYLLRIDCVVAPMSNTGDIAYYPVGKMFPISLKITAPCNAPEADLVLAAYIVYPDHTQVINMPLRVERTKKATT